MVAVGDFQTKTGCSSDWATGCLNSQRTDPDGDGTYTWTTTAIPAGNWNVKATIGNSWGINYGAGGAPGGANIPFTVAKAGDGTAFAYNSATHVLTVNGSNGSSPTATPTTSSPTPTPTTTSPTPTPTCSTSPGTPSTLGAIYTTNATTFRLWSPDNSNVGLNVNGANYAMTPAKVSGYTGVYQVVVNGDLKDKTYQFAVGGNAVRDPYANMVVPNTTQGVVVDISGVAPTSGSWAPTPALTNREDTTAYELDVRDYTIDASSGVDVAKRGKFLGLVQTGTTDMGVKTGIDHIKDLGVTAVQIMPTFDFNSTVPNWGYSPVNYNVPEEQFSQFTSPENRIREFKDMVNAFHQNASG